MSEAAFITSPHVALRIRVTPSNKSMCVKYKIIGTIHLASNSMYLAIDIPAKGL